MTMHSIVQKRNFADILMVIFVGAFAVFCLIPMILAFSWQGALIFVILYAFAYLFRIYITGKIGGITGDVMGAGTELAQVLFLILVIIMTRYAGLEPGKLVTAVRQMLVH